MNNQLFFYTGLFAFSGSITNYLAVYMLFEKIPYIYGSGVIPSKFKEFKSSIKNLMMEEFFTKENIDTIMKKELFHNKSIDFKLILNKINFEPTFSSLIQVISESSFGGMLNMFGGKEALYPLKEPFVRKVKKSIIEITQSKEIQNIIQEQLHTSLIKKDIQENITHIIEKRLKELTPKLVKEMIKKIIKEHLGWLVVWGGLFGGLIGIISSFIQM
ncbi:membrane protein [Candidatus Photodesmus katoptron]|uniref:DUF445 domain-containing protein n=1 Tax=Candidatus Photodesmus katoptron Akat1 TaxID=1236703 RepID=S3DH89_9GAMM|nr:hypothetical protein O1U_0249 [Candidatus Photodesmus katoptron Akat1]KEY90492.1 membrane protein [Candidatus Photodesmus katoptron]